MAGARQAEAAAADAQFAKADAEWLDHAARMPEGVDPKQTPAADGTPGHVLWEVRRNAERTQAYTRAARPPAEDGPPPSAIDRGSQRLPLALIDPDPNQPRQHFDQVALQELADSIVAEGLIQPITVRPVGDRFEIVAGERRWRAHQLAGLTEIEANVREMDDQTKMVQALIENSVRRDVTPLEEAVAYQRILDAGMAVEELARRLGINQAWRITERTCLLSLRPEYQQLLRAKQLTNSQGYELAQLSPSGQDRLFAQIKVGACDSYTALRAAALAIRESERQVDIFGDDGKPSDSEKRLAQGLESRFAQVIKCLQASTVDNEVVAVRKVNPDRAGTLADMAVQMRAELARIETALRSIAPQLELAAQ